MKTTTIQFTEAKARLSHYGRLAQSGQTMIVRKHSHDVFLIAPVRSEDKPCEKKTGIVKGKIKMASDFDSTPEAVIHDFEGIQ
ncbi:MAG: hypothetical protein U1E27_11390 [Kiritimatiellia bacterium]|nr:hypothetical protein [Kiritimatiellia bacterium]